MENTKGYKSILSSIKKFFANIFGVALDNVDLEAPDYGASQIVESDTFNNAAEVLSERMQALQVAIANGQVRQTLKGTALREIKQTLTPAGKRYLKANAADRVVSVNNTVKDRLKLRFQELADKKADMLEVKQVIRQELKDILSQGKADTIAVTEYRTAYTFGQNDALEALDNEVSGDGKKVARKWVTAGGPNVRDSHAALEGEVRDIDQAFSNGLMYPCDPSGPPEEVINCRCSIEPTVVDE